MTSLSIITVYKNPGDDLAVTENSVIREFGSSDAVEHVLKEWTSEAEESITGPTGSGGGMRRLKIRGMDSGVFDGMTRALKHATGEWILFLNAGDWLAEGFASKLSEALQDGSDKLDYLFFDGITVDCQDGREFQRRAPDELKLADFLFRAPVLHPGLIVRRNVMQAYSFNCNLYLAADFDLMVRLVVDKKCGRHVPFLGAYAVSGGLSEQFRLKARWQATRSLWKYASGVGERSKVIAAFTRFLVLHTLIVGIIHRLPCIRRKLHTMRALKNSRSKKATGPNAENL